jgi:lipid A 3-O-deacylase
MKRQLALATLSPHPRGSGGVGGLIRRAIVCVATAALALTTSSANAQPAASTVGRTVKPGELEIYEENDFFHYGTAKSQRTDQWYTQGFRVEWTHASDKDQEFFGDVPADFWCRWLCGRAYRFGFTNAGWAVGQNIYTPREISISTEQPADRPWAGYLYGSRLVKQSYKVAAWNAERQDRFEISLGVVGPLALGREVQNFVHRAKGIGEGMGWDHQLDNEPTILLRYDAILRLPACAKYVDFQPYGRAFLGTVLTAADLGASLRIGYNLAGFVRGGIQPAPSVAQATPSQISDAAPAGAATCPSPDSEGLFSSLAVFARVQARAVARNIFIDGNTFGDDLGLKKRTLVYETAAGIDVALIRGWGIAFQLVSRTEEFEGPAGSDGVHRFGAIQLHRVNRVN